MCGLQYVYAVERGEKPGIDLLAAPVMSGHRYANTPVYFSDVVVRTDSAARSLKDLRGARWAYNEPTSQSGYNITRYTLATRGELTGFFGEAIASGAHEQSLELLLRGEIDATAIDSTVLDQELRCRPDLAARIRVIEALGPSPIPPLVVSRSVPDPLRIRWQAIVLGMHTDPAGQGVLASGAVSRFSRVNDADYDAIREMDRVARDCRL
jgi:phosphonate transport system substrate-binding protein